MAACTRVVCVATVPGIVRIWRIDGAEARRELRRARDFGGKCLLGRHEGSVSVVPTGERMALLSDGAPGGNIAHSHAVGRLGCPESRRLPSLCRSHRRERQRSPRLPQVRAPPRMQVRTGRRQLRNHRTSGRSGRACLPPSRRRLRWCWAWSRVPACPGSRRCRSEDRGM